MDMKIDGHKYVISLDQEDLENKETMDRFQELMNEQAEATNKYIEDTAKKLNISESCAMDVVYLRTRARWTQKLEDELIRLHKEGNPPNVFDWP